MKIIDWERRGNVVRFVLGDDQLTDWWGDDWNDAPWDCNAGAVYREFVRGHVDLAFAFDAEIHEAGHDEFNTRWTKDHMVARHVPFLTINLPPYGERELYLGDPAADLDKLRHLLVA